MRRTAGPSSFRHADLESALAVGQDNVLLLAVWIAPSHLFANPRDDFVLPVLEARPDSFALRFGPRRLLLLLLALQIRPEQTLDDLLRGPYPRLHGVDRRYRGHALLVGLLALGATDRMLGILWLHHGDALAIDGPRDDRSHSFWRGGNTLGIERVKICRRLLDHLLGAPLWHNDARRLLHTFDGFVEGSLQCCLHHAPLELVGVGILWQSKILVQRVDRRHARLVVSQPVDLDFSEDRLLAAFVLPPVAKLNDLPIRLKDFDGGPNVAHPSCLDVCLEHQSLDFTASILLLPFDLIERKTHGLLREKPSLQSPELTARPLKAKAPSSICR